MFDSAFLLSVLTLDHHHSKPNHCPVEDKQPAHHPEMRVGPGDMDGDGGGGAASGNSEVPAREGFNWVEFNKQKKAESLEWTGSNPLLRLACMREVAKILLCVMYSFLHISSQRFEKKQRLLSQSGQQRSYPVLEAFHGKDVQHAMNDLEKLLWTKPAICLFDDELSPRLRALRFRMISCAMTSLHVLIRVRRRGCPYKLFSILHGQHEEVLHIPPCMRDQLTEDVLRKYATCLRFSF